MKYRVVLHNKVYEIDVEQGEALLLDVSDLSSLTKEASKTETKAKPTPQNQTTFSSPVNSTDIKGELILAPLPGLLIDIKVNVGDQVKKGQLLCIIEAMKMENEVLAPKDGKIAQILSTKGTKIESGQALLSLE